MHHFLFIYKSIILIKERILDFSPKTHRHEDPNFYPPFIIFLDESLVLGRALDFF